MESASESDALDALQGFLAQFLLDEEQGLHRPLADYQAKYPHHAAAIAQEYAHLVGEADPADEAAVQIGPYQLRHELGRGGQAVVWLAHDPRLQRDVALKILSTAASSLDQQQRLQREAMVAGRLADPGICTVYEAGRDGHHLYLAMQLVPGRTMAAHIAAAAASGTPLPIARVLDWFTALLGSLQHAHAAGIVHRDLKPGNVMITPDDRPVLLDFGLAVAEGTDGPLLTRSGDCFGTPAYLAPEQLRGERRDGASADLWATAVSLYEALASVRPFHGATSAAVQNAILAQRVPDLRQHRRAIPRELATVLAVALDPVPKHRYASAGDFAADLAAVAAGRPIAARAPGLPRRLLLWHRRHRVVAGATWLALVALGIGAERSLATARLAASLDAKVRDYDLLAGVPLYKNAMASAQRLFPAVPERLPAIDAWLRDEAAPLLAMREPIDAALRELQLHAVPRPEPAASRPFASEVELLELVAESLQRTTQRRSGEIEDAVAELPAELATATTSSLFLAAWQRTPQQTDLRSLFGDEALGLCCIEAVLQRIDAGDRSLQRTVAADLLPWALLANGRDEDAIAAGRAAVAAAPAHWRPTAELHLAQVIAASTGAPARLAAVTAELPALTAERDRPRHFELRDKPQQFLHDTLVTLATDLAALRRDTLVDMQRRRRWAASIGELTQHHPRARHSWAEVRAALAAADGVVASTAYRGQSLELPDHDVVGLVPIGRNPATMLWEFYDLRSAWDGATDPATLPIPEHQPDGSVPITDATGIVLVLLPGGLARIGVQSDDPAGPHYDPRARPDATPVHTVRLDPFFCARHELTQGQWLRLQNGDERRRRPSKYGPGMIVKDNTPTLAHPVEQVSWTMAVELGAMYGLQLPTEVQWEYACRANRDERWAGIPDLPREGNVADLDAKGWTNWPIYAPFHDGHVIHAPVGSFAANGFGLYDMHGNVEEWCRDERIDYTTKARDGDGARFGDSPRLGRVVRGGAFHAEVELTHAGARTLAAADQIAGSMGVRFVRPLRR